jgi:MauM/NapG family ferredoxin protein
MAKKSFVDLLKDIFKPPAGAPASADQKMDRRRFFRAGLAEMLKPLDAAIRPLAQVAHEVGKLDEIESRPLPKPRRSGVDRPWLRPPGAIAEIEFRNTCSQCGQCVSACPVYAIRIDHSGDEGAGYPYIDAEYQPCVLCDGQPCMPACPTGALQIVGREQIRMGLANWFEQTCRLATGEDCTICVDDCPIGLSAIEINDRQIVVKEDGCTGCGVCQNHCPTDPKSIIVIPKSAGEVR